METYKLTKQDKIEIVEEALEVLYRELNDYSVCIDCEVERLPSIIESISKLEKLKGEVIKND